MHDAVEDQGGLKTLIKIRKLFGSKVAKIVDECSDTIVVPKPPWLARKKKYIEDIRISTKKKWGLYVEIGFARTRVSPSDLSLPP